MARERPGASSFDELAVGLSNGSLSRGKALKLMGAALLGGTLASLGIGEAGAANLCRRNGKACKSNSQCCSGNCDSSSNTCAPACPDGRVALSNGTCADACTSSDPCPAGCGCSLDVEQALYCGTVDGASQDPCMHHSQCPPGEFCAQRGSGPPGFCIRAC
jgi:hypothetical protein